MGKCTYKNKQEAWQAGPQAWLDGPEGGTDRQMDRQANKQTENLPILQDLVPCLSNQETKNISFKHKSRAGLGNR